MFTELRKKAVAAVVRIVRTTCLLLGGALVFVALLAILTPLLLGMALLALAAQAGAAQAANPSSTVVTVG